MAIKIQDYLEVSLFFNNKEFPLESGSLNVLKIQECTKLALPTIYISVSDAANLLLESGLSDGTVITVIIKAKGQLLHKMSFLLYSYEQFWSGNCYTYEIDGYLCFPKFWAGTQEFPYSGTTSNIAKQIAQVCGLKFDGDSTSDNRYYCGLTHKYRDAVKDLAESAWGGERACYKASVTLDGVLKFKNVMNLNKVVACLDSNPLPGEKEGDEGKIPTYPILDFSITSNSGAYNASGVYQATVQAQSVAQPSEEVKNITVNTGVRNPNVNMKVRNAVGKGMNIFSPISTVETGNSTSKARYYNKRFSNMFSVEGKFISEYPTQLTLFDVFSFVPISPRDNVVLPIAGQYILCSRTIQIEQSNYMEIIVGTRMGTNGKEIS